MVTNINFYTTTDFDNQSNVDDANSLDSDNDNGIWSYRPVGTETGTGNNTSNDADFVNWYKFGSENNYFDTLEQEGDEAGSGIHVNGNGYEIDGSAEYSRFQDIGHDYGRDGHGSSEDSIDAEYEETNEIYNDENTETTLTTQPFSGEEIENGKAFLERAKTFENNPIDENQASYFFPRETDANGDFVLDENGEYVIDTTNLGRLGRIVGSPDPETGEFAGENGESDTPSPFRAGEVFVAGVVPGSDPVGSATSGADEHLSMELQAGNIEVDDFIQLSSDGAFLSRNEEARADYIRERYTDQGVDNIANGREPTNGEDNVYTSRDNLLFKVPDAAGDPDEGPVEPYFVMADGTPIPSNLQGQADAEGMDGGMSQRTIDGIAVLGGTMELSPEQQAAADAAIADYVAQSGDETLDQNVVTNDFLTRVQNEVLGDDAYANVTVENTMPETATPFISEGWQNTLYNDVVNGPDGLLANSQFIDGDTVTDADGLWGEIQERVTNSPQAQQFVYESITGSLYDTGETSVMQPPITGTDGEVLITSERRDFLDLIADDAVQQMANPDRSERLDDAAVSEKLQQSVTDGKLTQVEADYIEGKIDELQIMGPEEPVTMRWQQGSTPFLSDEQKQGYTADIAAFRQIAQEMPDGKHSVRIAIDREFPDASPQLKNFLHSQATGEAYFTDQNALEYDRDYVVGNFDIDPISHTEQKEAEAVIEEGLYIIDNDPEKNSAIDLVPELNQAVMDEELTPGQVDFIMSALISPDAFRASGGGSDW